MAPMPQRVVLGLAQRWRRACRSIEGPYRAAYLRSEMTSRAPEHIALALDQVCFAAEQAEPDAQELLIALVDLLAAHDIGALVRELKREAVARSLLSLERLLRRPLQGGDRAGDGKAPGDGASDETKIPDYGFGRPLTLGERKALARRPTRKAMDKLLSDPHPVVIRTLLGNPKLVEADVLRLAARRPGRPGVLAQIACNARWSRRRRIRMAIVLNPDAPLALTIPLLALLLRPELEQVVTSTLLDPVLRGAARDRLDRRPPSSLQPSTDKLQ
jgi:hypothetical protein